jgi:hypothetical protein
MPRHARLSSSHSLTPSAALPLKNSHAWGILQPVEFLRL